MPNEGFRHNLMGLHASKKFDIQDTKEREKGGIKGWFEEGIVGLVLCHQTRNFACKKL